MKHASFPANFSHLKVLFTAHNIIGWLSTIVPLRPLEDGAQGLEFNLDGNSLDLTFHGVIDPVPESVPNAISHHASNVSGHFYVDATNPPDFIGLTFSRFGVTMFVPLTNTAWRVTEIDQAFKGTHTGSPRCHSAEVAYRRKWGLPA